MLDKIKRKMRYELSCVNMKTLAVSAAAFALICILTSIFNVKSEVYKKFTAPKISLPVFFCILFCVLAAALLGAVFAIIISAPVKNERTKIQAAVLCVCAFVLENAWIALIYSAASFFIAALTVAVAALCCAGLFYLCRKINGLAAAATVIFGAWVLYMFYFSAALAVLS